MYDAWKGGSNYGIDAFEKVRGDAIQQIHRRIDLMQKSVFKREKAYQTSGLMDLMVQACENSLFYFLLKSVTVRHTQLRVRKEHQGMQVYVGKSCLTQILLLNVHLRIYSIDVTCEHKEKCIVHIVLCSGYTNLHPHQQ